VAARKFGEAASPLGHAVSFPLSMECAGLIFVLN
jgi:hypothetical protein